MIVVDTNIISYFYLNSEFSLLAEQVFEKDSVWAVPVLWRSEFRSVLSFYLRQKIIELGDAVQLMSLAEELLNDNEYKINSFQVLQLSIDTGCSAYDCEFVSLARNLGVTLVTEDKKILKSFPETAQNMEAFIQVFRNQD